MGVIVCFKCGSEDVKIMRENSHTIVYQCAECENKFVKQKRGVEVWNTTA
jgi:uncharacterized Zn finger protein